MPASILRHRLWSRCQFVEHGLLRYVQQQRVGQRLGEDDVGLLHEHDGFAEALALLHDLDDFLAALLRGEGQFDLAVNQQVETGAGVALVEQDVALAGVDLAGRAGNARNFLGRQPVEKRDVGQQRFDVDRVVGVHF